MNEDKINLLKIIDQITYLLELKGENVFKINAFRKAYTIISGISDDLSEMFDSGRLAAVPGIGKGILSVVADYFNMGYSSALRELEAEIPKGLIEINQIRGLGPKKAVQLYYDHEITDIARLEAFCLSGGLVGVKGFTQASADKLLQHIIAYKQNQTQLRLDAATMIVSDIEEKMRSIGKIELFSVSGDFRRSMEVISQLEFVIMTKDTATVLTELRDALALPDLEYGTVSSYKGKTKLLIHLEEEQAGFFRKLYTTTGSSEFVQKYDAKISIGKEVNSEVDIFDYFGFEYIIPEMREAGLLPRIHDARFEGSDLFPEDFKGCFHFHTNYSDGSNTLQEMVSAGIAMGYDYFAVCDHSKASFQANGLSEERVFQQKEEISRVADALGVTIFHGIEADILRDGTLDYGDEFLNNFDFVVASIHSRFSQNKEDMTTRIIRAVENRHADVLGHPSGRILLERPEFEADFDKIIDACKANDVALEINASAYRLDLDWRRIYRARETGCKFSINPDAHSTTQLKSVEYGIRIARKGGMDRNEVINCLALDEFRQFIRRK